MDTFSMLVRDLKCQSVHFLCLFLSVLEYDILAGANKGGNFTKRDPAPISRRPDSELPTNAIIRREL